MIRDIKYGRPFASSPEISEGGIIDVALIGRKITYEMAYLDGMGGVWNVNMEKRNSKNVRIQVHLRILPSRASLVYETLLCLCIVSFVWV